MPSGPASLDGVGRLLVSCTDRPGIVAAVVALPARARREHRRRPTSTRPTPRAARFFMRMEFRLDGRRPGGRARARRSPPRSPSRSAMDWRIAYARGASASRSSSRATTTACSSCCGAGAAASWTPTSRSSSSNHAELAARRRGASACPFEHVPVDARRRKPAAEAALLELLGGAFDLVVLARYMQILSRRLPRRRSARRSSTSTTRSCRPSRAPTPTRARTSAA